MADLAALERACEVVFGNAGTAAERPAAQERIMALGSDVSAMPVIQALLDNSSSGHAVMAASQALLRLVTGRKKTKPPARRMRTLPPYPQLPVLCRALE